MRAAGARRVGRAVVPPPPVSCRARRFRGNARGAPRRARGRPGQAIVLGAGAAGPAEGVRPAAGRGGHVGRPAARRRCWSSPGTDRWRRAALPGGLARPGRPVHRLPLATCLRCWPPPTCSSCPARGKGQSLVLQEALRAGVPVVATRVGGNAELTGQDAALLVPPGDPQPLAAAVRSVLGDPALAARLRQAAARRSRELPGEDEAVAAALAEYRRVAPGPNRRPLSGGPAHNETVTYGQAAAVCPQCGSAARCARSRNGPPWPAARDPRGCRAAPGRTGAARPAASPRGRANPSAAAARQYHVPAPQPGYPRHRRLPRFPDPSRYQQPSGFPGPSQYQQPSGFPDPSQYQQPGSSGSRRRQRPRARRTRSPRPRPDHAPGQRPGSRQRRVPATAAAGTARSAAGRAAGPESWQSQPPRRSPQLGRRQRRGHLRGRHGEAVLGAAPRPAPGNRPQLRPASDERSAPATAAHREAVLERVASAQRHPDLRACLADQGVFLVGGTRVLPRPVPCRCGPPSNPTPWSPSCAADVQRPRPTSAHAAGGAREAPRPRTSRRGSIGWPNRPAGGQGPAAGEPATAAAGRWPQGGGGTLRTQPARPSAPARRPRTRPSAADRPSPPSATGTG